jgi:zinc/manganese transport system permease protein
MWEILAFLFPPFVACLSMLGILGYLGIHVLEREIIFIDIALAQIAAVGATCAIVFLGVEEQSPVALVCAISVTVLAALFFSTAGKRITQISQEAVIGVSYAIAAAAALLFLALAAGGDVHVEHMLTGSILWASWPDIIFGLVIYTLVAVVHYIFRDRFIAVSRDYRQAAVGGIRVEWWDFLFYVSLGIVITITVKIAGILVIFSLLIIPATFSALFVSTWRKRLIYAWGMGTTAITAGLAFSYIFDFSCGPSVVSFLGLELIAAALFKRKGA